MQIFAVGTTSALPTYNPGKTRDTASSATFGVALSAEQPSTASAVAPTTPDPSRPESYLTDNDRKVILAVTGFEISKEGVVKNVGHLEPNTPWPLIGAIENQRTSGGLGLTRPLDADAFNMIYANSDRAHQPLDPKYLTAALKYFADQRDVTSAPSTRPGVNVLA